MSEMNTSRILDPVRSHMTTSYREFLTVVDEQLITTVTAFPDLSLIKHL